MNSSERSEKIPATAICRESLPLFPIRKKPRSNGPRGICALLSVVGLAAALTFEFSGCATRTRLYSAREAVDAISKQSSQIHTERGRAWISARSPQQKISFPAVIAVDRTDPRRPLLRIEAMDPLGATHALLILDAHSRLTWVDYDARTIYEVRNYWYGIPLARLPELLLGFLPIPDDGKVGVADADGFEVRSGGNILRYIMSWIDPGPRLALSTIEGTVHASGGKAEKYVVQYSHFLDKDDYYLPSDSKLLGYSEVAHGPSSEINVAWRERRWNETIPMQVFALPAGLEKFSRENQ
ncbi:MAG: hypothetical protein HY074_02650 [Deltaproteobacteria bacterium]|nr:hypothetical protein [Deltaproteobacteria bacterium]